VRPARRLTVDAHAESNGRPRSGRTHHEMKVAGVEPEEDQSARLVQLRELPGTVQSPESAH